MSLTLSVVFKTKKPRLLHSCTNFCFSTYDPFAASLSCCLIDTSHCEGLCSRITKTNGFEGFTWQCDEDYSFMLDRLSSPNCRFPSQGNVLLINVSSVIWDLKIFLRVFIFPSYITYYQICSYYYFFFAMNLSDLISVVRIDVILCTLLMLWFSNIWVCFLE